MQEALLALINCPACQSTLSVDVAQRLEAEIWHGTLTCTACGATYPVQNGMPQLYLRNHGWKTKEIEAEGWVAYHKNLGIYDVAENPVDLQIPYYPQPPWINVARSFDIALQTLQLTGNEVILDLGAGRGWAAKQFALRGCRVVALDVVPDENVGLGRAHALMRHAGVYFDRIIGDGENLPFFPAQFDVVFCAAALHHSSHLGLMMQQIGRVLRPGGRLCAINEPCRSVLDDEQAILTRDATAELEVGINETRPTLREYEAALNQAGLVLRAAFPPVTQTMDLPTLRNWAASTGAVRPSLRQRPLSQQWLGWRNYTDRLIKAFRQGGAALAQPYRADERAQLETAVLHWLGSELFLLAEKPA